MSADIINYLQHRIEETKQDLQSASDRVQQAIADRDMLNVELQGYQTTLAAEMRRQGISAAEMPATHVPLPLNGDAGPSGVISKAEFVRRFVREHVATGVTPADMVKGLVQAGIPMKKPYIYSLVQRLQKQGAIRARRGRYYPAEMEPPEASRETVQ